MRQRVRLMEKVPGSGFRDVRSLNLPRESPVKRTFAGNRVPGASAIASPAPGELRPGRSPRLHSLLPQDLLQRLSGVRSGFAIRGGRAHRRWRPRGLWRAGGSGELESPFPVSGSVLSTILGHGILRCIWFPLPYEGMPPPGSTPGHPWGPPPCQAVPGHSGPGPGPRPAGFQAFRPRSFARTWGSMHAGPIRRLGYRPGHRTYRKVRGFPKIQGRIWKTNVPMRAQ